MTEKQKNWEKESKLPVFHLRLIGIFLDPLSRTCFELKQMRKMNHDLIQTEAKNSKILRDFNVFKKNLNRRMK